MVKIDCISDLHGHYPELEGGDLLIVAGDLTARDDNQGWVDFEHWICNQHYKEKIIIAGNHDNFLTSMPEHNMWKYWDKVRVTYLCDESTEFEGLRIWGSPWTLRFPGMNPHCMAFTVDTEEELAEKWAMIPEDTDILVTHSPSSGMHDKVNGMNKGSASLVRWIADHVNTLKLFVCGHIHEGYGIYDVRKLQDKFDEMYTPIHVNASHVNERYEPVNKPIRIVL